MALIDDQATIQEKVKAAKEERRALAEGRENVPNAADKNAATINRWLPEWFRNLRKNAGVIDHDFEHHGDRNACNAVPKWFREEGNGCALVLGSGPSLDKMAHYKTLLRDWKGLIVAGSSNGTVPPGICGRYPDVVVAVDSSLEVWRQLRWAPFSDNGTLLMTNPYIHWKVLELFKPWQRYYYKSFIPYTQHPMNWYLTMLFHNQLENFMLQAGCTANAEVLWCSLPHRKNLKGENELLIKKVFILGIDFGYPMHPTEGYPMGRAAPFRWVDGHGFVRPDLPPRPRTRSTYMTANNGSLTDQAMIGYKRSLLTLIKMLTIGVYQCSDMSTVTELPYTDLGEVLASQGECAPPWDAKAYHEIYKEYILREGPDEIVDKVRSVPTPGGDPLEVEPSAAHQDSQDQEGTPVPGGSGVLPSPEDDSTLLLREDNEGILHVAGNQTVRHIQGASEGRNRETSGSGEKSEGKE